jgi:hypothetical protein
MPTPSQPPPDPAEHLRYVFLERPKCPVCHSPGIRTIRSENQGDGTMRRRTQCRDCQHVFFVIVQ